MTFRTSRESHTLTIHRSKLQEATCQFQLQEKKQNKTHISLNNKVHIFLLDNCQHIIQRNTELYIL